MAHLGSLPLRVEFVQTLCIADKLGFLKSIENIAKELHIQKQKSTKMPHSSLPKLRNELKKSPPPSQESAEQPWDAESLKDDSTVVVREAGHPLPLSEREDDPNSFLKEDSDLESAPETDSLSSTSDKSDPSQELTLNCTHFPQSSNGVAPAIDMGLSGTAVLQPPSVEELSASDGGCSTGSASRGGCGIGSASEGGCGIGSASGGGHGTGSELLASGGGRGTGSELSASGGRRGTGNELSATGGGRGTGSEMSAGGGGCGTGNELSAGGGGRGTGSELSAGGGGRGTGSELDAGRGGCGNRRDKHRGHPKAATHGGSKWFGRNKKQAACGTEKTKVPVVLYNGMGAGRFCM